jgi:hypothetical protein
LKRQVESELVILPLMLIKAANFAKVYSKEVEKYLRRFKIAKREHSKWKNKIKQTINAVLKITMDFVNGRNAMKIPELKF